MAHNNNMGLVASHRNRTGEKGTDPFNKLNVILSYAMRVSEARASHRWLRTIIESQLSAVRGWCEWSSSSRPIAHIASQWWWWGLI